MMDTLQFEVWCGAPSYSYASQDEKSKGRLAYGKFIWMRIDLQVFTLYIADFSQARSLPQPVFEDLQFIRSAAGHYFHAAVR